MVWKTYEVTMRSLESYTVNIKARNEAEAMEKATNQCDDFYEAEDAFEINDVVKKCEGK